MKISILKCFYGIFICAAIISSCNKIPPPEEIIPVKSTLSKITEFTVTIDSKPYSADIDTVNKTIKLELPFGTALTNLIPKITISDKSAIEPKSDISQDFSKTTEYKVTSESGIITKYQVSISTSKPVASDFKSLSSKWKNVHPTIMEIINVDSANIVWGARSNEIYTYQNSVEKLVLSLPSNSYNIVIDFSNDETLVGSTTGLVKIKNGQNQVYNKQNSILDSDTIVSVKRNGNSFDVLTSNSLYNLEKNTFKKLFTRPNSNFKDVVFSQNQYYLINNASLFTFDKTLTELKSFPEPLFYYAKLKADNKGTIWVSEWSSLYKFDNGIFKEYSNRTIPGLPGAGMSNFIIDQYNLIWMAWGKAGLTVLGDGKLIHHFTTANANFLSDVTTDIIYNGHNIYLGQFVYPAANSLYHGFSSLKYP